MKLTVLVVCVAFGFVLFCNFVSGDVESNGPIQIIKPDKHSFQLELDELKFILEADHIKDRHVVVVSIAGAFRKGKSFLLNFFLKYLYAQVPKKNNTKNRT